MKGTRYDRRFQEVIDFEQDGYHYRLAIGLFEDGIPAEVFIDSARAGSTMDSYGHDVASLVTLLLQSGSSISQIEESLDRSPNDGLAARVVRLISGADQRAGSGSKIDPPGSNPA